MSNLTTFSTSFPFTNDDFSQQTVSMNIFNANTAAPPSEGTLPVWTGFIGCLIASIFFGSNLVPVKQFSAGDGFFFQFVFCVAVWIVGLILDLILGNQRFYPLVILGGVLWTTGNLVTVFCIKTCGLAVGLLIWGTTSLIMGWASGRFGIFGLTPQVPKTTSKLALNYSSVVLAALSAVFFLLIKSSPSRPRTRTIQQDESVNMDSMKTRSMSGESTVKVLDTDFPFLNRISEPIQKVLGCFLAALAGVFYGLMFIPDQHIRDNQQNFKHNNELPSKNGLNYIKSQYSGILLSSTFYFIVYAALKRNRPAINADIVLPAMVSGAMWAVANIGFIVAISTLSSAVAYPIVSVLPGIVTSLWSLFWFREIVGRNNYIFLGCGMFLRCLAALLSGLSA